MPDAVKITVLLADDDALRRDGLAAVLEGAPNLVVVARCQDGEAALEAIRGQGPRVAVVDINLSRLHGIELVRRVRAEKLGTKVIVLSGTSDDEIIREVVRAGADGYLLKNGPARHLVDAIQYVCDGGQYFSPQLGRDGRDRHLLEEPPREAQHTVGRVQPEPLADEAPASRVGYDDRPRRQEAAGRAGPRTGASHLRERLREESGQPDDRDYKIMSMVADGMKPILDRLEEIDDRVAQMEDGDADLPEDPRGWLSIQLADTFRGDRGESRGLARNPRDIEARLPQMIEQAVTERFEAMAGKLQQEIEETHVKTLETFVKNVQVKLVQRVSSLEQDMARHTHAMLQLRDSSQRTEDNLTRLISGVDKLAQELPKRIAAATHEARAEQGSNPEAAGEGSEPEPKKVKKRSRRSARRGPLLVWGGIAAALALGGAVYLFYPPSSLSNGAAATSGVSGSKPAAGKPAPLRKLPPGADTRTRMQAAQEYVDRKEYAMAEDLYKQVVQAEPQNAEAVKALASVLYREDKLAESAAVLDKLR